MLRRELGAKSAAWTAVLDAHKAGAEREAQEHRTGLTPFEELQQSLGMLGWVTNGARLLASAWNGGEGAC